MTNLHASLNATYDRTLPTDGGDQRFKIDDEGPGDRYPGFCRIFLTVVGEASPVLTLELDNAPHNGGVAELVREANGDFNGCPLGARITLRLGPRDGPLIRKLAKAIRRVTGRGQRYQDCNWKWLVPRTADSLERLADILRCARRQKSTTSAAIKPEH